MFGWGDFERKEREWKEISSFCLDVGKMGKEKINSAN